MTREERQVHDRIKTDIEKHLAAAWPEMRLRLAIGEACERIRQHAPGRALEVLEEVMVEFERRDAQAIVEQNMEQIAQRF